MVNGWRVNGGFSTHPTRWYSIEFERIKMKKYRRFHLFVTTLLLILVGCRNETLTPTPTPDEISNSLIIKYYEGPEIQIYGHIQAIVQNTSDFCIEFPIDLGIKLFVDQNGTVSEINNYTKYIGNQKRVLNPIGERNDFISVSYDPDVSGLIVTDSMTFYAEFTGHLCDDETVIIQKKIPFNIVP